MPKFYTQYIVDAIQYLSYNAEEVIQFTEGQATKQPIYSSLLLNENKIGVGDYVVKDNGKLIVMHPHQFEAKYKPIK
jgi:hypothetical protein